MSRQPTLRQRLLLILGLIALPPSIFAIDGVVEINAARAFVGGITAGDAPDYPVTLSEPGSYVLTGELQSFASDDNVIEITSSFVTLDLNGFAVRGPSICTGSGGGVSCTVVGGGSGIQVLSDFVSIRNGSVIGAANAGILVLGDYVSIDQVKTDRNAFMGIVVVESVIGTSIRHSQAIGNRSTGITLEKGALIRDSLVSQNLGDGIVVRDGSLVTGNISRANGFSGIRVRSGVANVCENTLRENAAFGIEGPSEGTAAAGRNVISANLSAETTSGVVEMGTNMCGNNTTCP